MHLEIVLTFLAIFSLQCTCGGCGLIPYPPQLNPNPSLRNTPTKQPNSTALPTTKPPKTIPPPLLVVSFDGLRREYFDTLNSSHFFYRFINAGVVATNVISVFPADTFPNHFSIATGLWPENHGIVANEFYDPDLNDSFNTGRLEPEFWNGGEPIWVKAGRLGKKSIIEYWPGSAVPYPPDSFLPTFFRAVYDADVPYADRIDETVSKLAEQQVNLAFLYYQEPDMTGHLTGPDSTDSWEQLNRIDDYFGYLLSKLEVAGLNGDKINMIVLSDHGMTEITEWHLLSNFVDLSLIERIPHFGVVTFITPINGYDDRVYAQLKSNEFIGQKHIYTTYRKADMSAEFTYGNNRRISDIVVLCEIGVYLSATGDPPPFVATHGYDPRHPDMRPLFIGRGPAFKTSGYQSNTTFYTKDIYAIMEYALGFPEPGQGTNTSLDSVRDVLRVIN